MKKSKLFVALLLVCALVFSACGSKEDKGNNATQGNEEENPGNNSSSNKGEVYVYNWGEYIDRDVISMFEKETGIKVFYQEFELNEDMYPIIKTGAVNYDVVCPSDYMIEKMIQEDLLAEINYDNVPNITNIDELYLKTAESFDPGNKFSVPYCWGTVGILYNKTMVDEPIDSWGVLFDEKYKNDILMIDSVRDAFMVALTYLQEIY